MLAAVRDAERVVAEAKALEKQNVAIRKEAERLKIPFLGEVPIFTEIREGGDRGMPIVVSAPDQPAGQAFLKIAEAVRDKLK